jgi:hypothetical protein
LKPKSHHPEFDVEAQESPSAQLMVRGEVSHEAAASDLFSMGDKQQGLFAESLKDYQHLPDRCEKCAVDCKSSHRRFICNCGAVCCTPCYGYNTRNPPPSDVSGYQCDTCRAEHGETVVLHPRKDSFYCYACRAELQETPGKDVQSLCPGCQRRFCHQCAALACSESPCRLGNQGKRSSKGEFAISLLCPTCDGFARYEAGRVAVCKRLIEVLGSDFQATKSDQITQAQFETGKGSADELCDLLYDCFYHGFRATFQECFPPFLEVVLAQLRLKQAPSVEPFHLLYYMGQTPECKTALLAGVCQATADHALSKGQALYPQSLLVEDALSKSQPDTVTEPRTVSHERPPILKVVLYGSDVLQNSPTADLVLSVLEYWISSEGQSGRFAFFLFADGPIDKTHPLATTIASLFRDGNRLTLFTKRMSAKTKYEKMLEKKPHILLTLTGWTNGHIAEVIAAVGRGPGRVLVFDWFGFAGLMCMKEAVHFTVLGPITGSPRQLQECETYRERVAVVSCYQPAQSHPTHDPSHWKADSSLPVMSRTYFNLPSSETHFIFVFPGMINRIVEGTFNMWLEILVRVEHSCLLLLNKPAHMHTRIIK